MGIAIQYQPLPVLIYPDPYDADVEDNTDEDEEPEFDPKPAEV